MFDIHGLWMFVGMGCLGLPPHIVTSLSTWVHVGATMQHACDHTNPHKESTR